MLKVQPTNLTKPYEEGHEEHKSDPRGIIIRTSNFGTTELTQYFSKRGDRLLSDDDLDWDGRPPD